METLAASANARAASPARNAFRQFYREFDPAPAGTLKLLAIKPSMLRDEQIEQMARLIHFRWSQKDRSQQLRLTPSWNGAEPTVEYYVQQLCQLRDSGTTPVFALEKGGEVVGALITLTWKGELPRKYRELVNDGYAGKDSPDGETMICRCISVAEGVQGGARMLIEGGSAFYAMAMMEKGELRRLSAYSRPAGYGKYAGIMPIKEYLAWTVEPGEKPDPDNLEQRTFYDEHIAVYGKTSMADFLKKTGRRHVDLTIGMHLSFGAEMLEIYPGGCPNDASAGGYIIIMEYTNALLGIKGKGLDAAFRHGEDNAYLPSD